MVDTSDLKSDSNKSIGSSPITSTVEKIKFYYQNDGIGRHVRFRF